MTMIAMTNALATNLVINPALPGMSNASTTGPAGWIVGFYNFALLFAGILAFGAIVYGGVKAAASAGNPSKISEGRAYIYSSLIGLLLLACAWLILNTINPNLTKLQVPTLSAVNTQSSNTTNSGVTCASPNFACGSNCCTSGQTCGQTGAGPTCQGIATCNGTCGGSCSGSCPSGQACQVSGNGYACQGQAIGGVCGVCGGTCNGTCPTGKTCTNVPSYGYVCG